MASRTTLTAKNLEALGAARLAELLLELGTADTATRRRLRLELAGEAGPAEAAKEIRKALASFARGRSFVEWRKTRAMAADLDVQRQAIVARVGKADPREGMELAWTFLALAPGIYERSDDSGGTLGQVFRAAAVDLGTLAQAAKPEPLALADRVFAAVCDNRYGEHDDIIPQLAPALGATGLAHLKARIEAFGQSPIPMPAAEDRVPYGWSPSGAIYRDEIEQSTRATTVSVALQQIADATGDVDAYISQLSAKARRVPEVAAEIACRLLDAGRAEEAWKAISAADDADRLRVPEEWIDARLAVMEALGMTAEAQAFRWQCFERLLLPSYLRDYLKRLPDFDDVEAEARALDLVAAAPHRTSALWFLLSWPALDRAASLVLDHRDAWDGNQYELLSPAAEALEARHLLAATLLRRAMIDFTLAGARSSRYRHAARHLLECRGLAAGIDDFAPSETHEAYVARLRREHGRKPAFWSLVD